MVFETKDLVSTAENCHRGWDGCICTVYTTSSFRSVIVMNNLISFK